MKIKCILLKYCWFTYSYFYWTLIYFSSPSDKLTLKLHTAIAKTNIDIRRDIIAMFISYMCAFSVASKLPKTAYMWPFLSKDLPSRICDRSIYEIISLAELNILFI